MKTKRYQKYIIAVAEIKLSVADCDKLTKQELKQIITADIRNCSFFLKGKDKVKVSI